MSHNSIDLVGKTAVVTGANSGIGAGAARALHAAGADVLLVARNEARLAEVADELSGRRGRIGLLSVDMTCDEAPAQVIDRVITGFGGIDILVNAAGVFDTAPLKETSDDALDRQWNINVRAPFRLARDAAMHMNAGSSIIFVSSIGGRVGFPNASAYCATKGAVEMMVKSMGIELAPKGIRVNAVAPGNVRTNINGDLLADPAYEQDMLDATPAGRIGEIDDIVPAVVFLASPAARYMNGSTIVIDGGWTAR
ncbi:2,5-dichloro-2,5-cyclohexadiene-1,4-diol dehydrogenase [Mycobacterium sp. SWH-M3]|uniref:SDR family NAD(P)-dependent oxidoreductase n=1 Tax=Mycolicibacterium sp. TaxID=2320850 RepID=UPI000940352E|nr:2,5-dichloro-2,5-cyclohexadiene-1,4-diol dehydrogenase [Mycobacterium sp. SWH-M3]